MVALGDCLLVYHGWAGGVVRLLRMSENFS
jgi:hypothetical protein